jgi:molybdopterin-guanine dinucleotide biosynthesis protein A
VAGPPSLRIAGLILAGGRSRRLGRDKLWLPVAGEPMLTRVAAVMRAAVSDLAVATRVDQPLPDLPAGTVVLYDRVTDRGPLQGLWEGLCHFDGRAGALLVAPGDAGGLTAPWLEDLMSAFQPGADEVALPEVVIPEVAGERLPLPGVYALSVRSRVEGMLSPPRGLVHLLARCRVRTVALAPPPPPGSFSVNTPEEYEALCRRFEAR